MLNEGYEGLSDTQTESSIQEGDDGKEDDVIGGGGQNHVESVAVQIEHCQNGVDEDTQTSFMDAWFPDPQEIHKKEKPQFHHNGVTHISHLEDSEKFKELKEKYPPGNYKYCDPNLKERFPPGRYENCDPLDTEEIKRQTNNVKNLTFMSERSNTCAKSMNDISEYSYVQIELNEVHNPLYCSAEDILYSQDSIANNIISNNIDHYPREGEPDNFEGYPSFSINVPPNELKDNPRNSLAESISNQMLFSTQSCPNSPLFNRTIPTMALNDDIISDVIRNHVRQRHSKACFSFYSETNIIKAVKLNGVLRPLGNMNVDDSWEMTTCF